jgi:predicted nucleic acid-binding protein
VIHLDTSFLIRSLLPGSLEDRALRRWLGAGEPLGIAALAWSEFLCGPVSAQAAELADDLLGEPVPFDGAVARLAAELFNRSGRRRGSLMDCMIAATAIARDAALATANRADFRRLEPLGLRIEAVA